MGYATDESIDITPKIWIINKDRLCQNIDLSMGIRYTKIKIKKLFHYFILKSYVQVTQQTLFTGIGILIIVVKIIYDASSK